jgi:hypothetical protein
MPRLPYSGPCDHPELALGPGKGPHAARSSSSRGLPHHPGWGVGRRGAVGASGRNLTNGTRPAFPAAGQTERPVVTRFGHRGKAGEVGGRLLSPAAAAHLTYPRRPRLAAEGPTLGEGAFPGLQPCAIMPQ